MPGPPEQQAHNSNDSSSRRTSSTNQTDMSNTNGQELPGCAPHASDSDTTNYFLKPDAPQGQMALKLCEHEAAVFSSIAGSHQIPDGAMCICNPYLPDCPLTFANETFCKQTGYPVEGIIGRNCRFLQCGETSQEVVKAMGDCFKTFQKRRRADIPDGSKTFRVINCKKDGTRFLNLVHMAPLYDRNNKLVRILGVQYGLALIAGPGLDTLFQGVITDLDPVENSAHSLSEWGGWKPVSKSGQVASREQAIAHMQGLMTSAINDICNLVDYDQMELVAAEADQRIASTLALKRPFMTACGGPQGKPMQGMVAPPKRMRSVILA